VITRTRAITLPDSAGEAVEIDMGGWPVVESFSPPAGDCLVCLTDLSHRPKAIVQGPAATGLGLSRPGQASWNGQVLVGRAKADKAIVLDLSGPVEPQWPDSHYTDVTDGWVLLAIWGPRALDVVQRLVSVDVERPDIDGPVFFATGAHGIRVQLFNLRGRRPGFVIACDLSQGQNLFDACVRAGHQFDMKLAGVKPFNEWLGNHVG
jgi:hypothetical protein